jgi:hypothetical protein
MTHWLSSRQKLAGQTHCKVSSHANCSISLPPAISFHKIARNCRSKGWGKAKCTARYVAYLGITHSWYPVQQVHLRQQKYSGVVKFCLVANLLCCLCVIGAKEMIFALMQYKLCMSAGTVAVGAANNN